MDGPRHRRDMIGLHRVNGLRGARRGFKLVGKCRNCRIERHKTSNGCCLRTIGGVAVSCSGLTRVRAGANLDAPRGRVVVPPAGALSAIPGEEHKADTSGSEISTAVPTPRSLDVPVLGRPRDTSMSPPGHQGHVERSQWQLSASARHDPTVGTDPSEVYHRARQGHR